VIFLENHLLTYLLIPDSPLPLILWTKERMIAMTDTYDPIDSLVSELKRNAGFLDKMLFPKVSLIIGIVGVLVALVLLIK
jgi:hypothetical protein